MGGFWQQDKEIRLSSPQPLLTHQTAELPPKGDFWLSVKLFIPQEVYLSRLLFLATRVNV